MLLRNKIHTLWAVHSQRPWCWCYCDWCVGLIIVVFVCCHSHPLLKR